MLMDPEAAEEKWRRAVAEQEATAEKARLEQEAAAAAAAAAAATDYRNS